ncbi:MAG: GtrA family protein [Arcobacteraceae bacterium]
MLLNNKLIRFILVGILNTAFGYSLFALFIFLNMHYSLAVFLSTVLGVLFNFKTIGKLVFDSHDNSLIYRFVSIYIILYLINISCLWLFKISGWENMYMNGFLLLVPLALISFVLNKKFVFKGKKDEKN